jgi:hypothetical protein
MRWAGLVARMGEERKLYKVLVGKPEGKRPLGRPRHRWEDGIRMELMLGRLAWRGGVLDSTGSGQGPVAGYYECGDDPLGCCAMEVVIRGDLRFSWRLDPCPQSLLFRSYESPLLPYFFTSVPEDGDSMFIRNVGIDLQINTAPKHKTTAA